MEVHILALFALARAEPAAAPYAGDFPDPYVVPVAGGYLAFATNTPWARVPVLASDDLERWAPVGDALPNLPPWADPVGNFTWAPSVLDRGDGTWVLFFVSRDHASGRQCIGAALAATAAGPYAPQDQPLVCQVELGGSIDPDPFRDRDGTVYLLWKSDGNCCGLRVSLWSRALAPDGVSFAGDAAELLTVDRAWEEPLIENPAMYRDAGGYHLLYSGGWWESPTYAVGRADCESPRGPCAKVGDAPMLASSDGTWGPGGQAVFVGHDGVPRLAYHGWDGPVATYASGASRTLRLAPLAFDRPADRLIALLSAKVFGPILAKAPDDYPDEAARHRLAEVQRRAQSELDRLRSVGDAQRVRAEFHDLASPDAEAEQARRALGLPTLPDVRDEFDQLCAELGVG